VKSLGKTQRDVLVVDAERGLRVVELEDGLQSAVGRFCNAGCCFLEDAADFVCRLWHDS
jgi:hypothetical protein